MADKKTQAYYEMPEFIKKTIDERIAIATEEELEKAKERISERKSEIITGVILHVERQMRIETIGEHLTITIKQ